MKKYFLYKIYLKIRIKYNFITNFWKLHKINMNIIAMEEEKMELLISINFIAIKKEKIK